MQFQVRHGSVHRYDVPVALGPHILRLSPRPGAGRVSRHQVRIEPKPVQCHDALDAFGSQIKQLEFSGTTRLLRIDSRLEAETFGHPAAAATLPGLPWSADAGEPRAGYGGRDPSVQQLAGTLATEVAADPVAFLDLLCETLYGRIEHEIRVSGAARSPAETLAIGRGACRDVTVPFMEAARSQGRASRFVSGYRARAETPGAQRHLHAWAQVFLPGVGWRGWDVTHGQPAGEEHLPLCVAPTQEGTMPVEGAFTFQGRVPHSTLDHSC